MRQTISNCKFLRSDYGWKNDETRVCLSGWTSGVGIDGNCPSVGRGRYGAADACSVAGVDNDGCALSRIDEWAGAADMLGAYDVFTARLIKAHGFKGAFVGSSVVNQALVGAPDQALVTVSEIIDYNCVIAANVDIPILADVDDFG